MPAKEKITDEVTKEAMEFYLNLFHPNHHTYELDEYTRYIFKYCQQWMTDDERRATLYLAFIFSANASTNQKDRKFWQRYADKILDERIKLIIEDGEEAFFYKVRDRIMSDYGDKPFNLCPQCGALARTATAKQCPKCFHQ
jgi:hypothetical protein